MRLPLLAAFVMSAAFAACAQGSLSPAAPVRAESASLFEREVGHEVDSPAEDELAHPAATRQGGKPRGVILYGASWCGACHQAAAFLRSQGIAFVEHDIEREPNARTEMQAKCAGAHLACTGIPVLDVGGQIFQGFDAQSVLRALGR